jgi:glutaredoxin 3
MKAIVWSKYDCTFCDQAKALLTQKGYTIEERKIGDGWSKEELLEAVPTARSVPQIFINDNLIGGFDQLKRYIEETTSDYGDGSL